MTRSLFSTRTNVVLKKSELLQPGDPEKKGLSRSPVVPFDLAQELDEEGQSPLLLVRGVGRSDSSSLGYISR